MFPISNHMLLSCHLPRQNTSGSCPRVLPSSTNDGRYYLHEGLSPPDVSLTLNAQNLISPVSACWCELHGLMYTLMMTLCCLYIQPVGYSYQCELSDVGRTFSAVVHNSSTLICNIDNAVSIPQAHTESPLRLLWSNNSTMMNIPIETSSGTDQRGLLCECTLQCLLFVCCLHVLISMCMDSSHVSLGVLTCMYCMWSSSHSLHCLSVYTVVLYSCPELAVDCSGCIGLNDNFNCAYCTTASGSCILSTLTCSPGSLVESPNFDQCPTPIITEVCTSEHDCVNACTYWVFIV